MNSVSPSTMPRRMIDSSDISIRRQATGLVVEAKRPCGRYCTSQAGATASIGVGVIPNASSPFAPGETTLSDWSISHWSRVIGAPGSNGGTGAGYVIYGRDFTGSVTQQGGTGNDSITGGGADEIFIGAEGNDRLDGAGGALSTS